MHRRAWVLQLHSTTAGFSLSPAGDVNLTENAIHSMGPAGDVNITEELAIVTSAMPAMSKRTQDMIEFMGAAGFIFINDAWEPVAYCFDTLSMSALYNEDHVPDPLPDGWRWDSIQVH
jgi:hypothetical protein